MGRFENLTEITSNGKVKKIWNEALSNLKNLEKFDLDEENVVFIGWNGLETNWNEAFRNTKLVR